MLPFHVIVATHPRPCTFSLPYCHVSASRLPQSSRRVAARDPYLFTYLLRYLLSPNSFKIFSAQVVTSLPTLRPHKSFSCNTYKKQGGGVPVIVNQESDEDSCPEVHRDEGTLCGTAIPGCALSRVTSHQSRPIRFSQEAPIPA